MVCKNKDTTNMILNVEFSSGMQAVCRSFGTTPCRDTSLKIKLSGRSGPCVQPHCLPNDDGKIHVKWIEKMYWTLINVCLNYFPK